MILKMMMMCIIIPEIGIFFVDDTFDEYFNKDLAMVQIEKLIENSCKKINSEISDISDKFRNNILKSSLDVNEQYTDPHRFI